MPVTVFAQRLTQQRDIGRQVSLLDKAIGPDLAHQFIFFNQMAAATNKRVQSVENFR